MKQNNINAENLICPVCKSNLAVADNSLKCENNHCYDISKYGYINLLMCNAKSSKNPGDNKMMVDSRKRFLDLGEYDFLSLEIAKLIKNLNRDCLTILDLGCGEGHFTSQIHRQLSSINAKSYGVDISKEGITTAGKRRDDITYLVASAFDVPMKDNSVDVLISIMAPLKEQEVKRLLKKDGILIVVRPGNCHLKNLREFLFENAKDVEKQTQFELFDVVDKQLVTQTSTLSPQNLVDLLTMTPYGYRVNEQSKNKLLDQEQMDMTYQFIIHTLKGKE